MCILPLVHIFSHSYVYFPLDEVLYIRILQLRTQQSMMSRICQSPHRCVTSLIAGFEVAKGSKLQNTYVQDPIKKEVHALVTKYMYQYQHTAIHTSESCRQSWQSHSFQEFTPATEPGKRFGSKGAILCEDQDILCEVPVDESF